MCGGRCSAHHSCSVRATSSASRSTSKTCFTHRCAPSPPLPAGRRRERPETRDTPSETPRAPRTHTPLLASPRAACRAMAGTPGRRCGSGGIQRGRLHVGAAAGCAVGRAAAVVCWAGRSRERWVRQACAPCLCVAAGCLLGHARDYARDMRGVHCRYMVDAPASLAASMFQAMREDRCAPSGSPVNTTRRDSERTCVDALRVCAHC